MSELVITEGMWEDCVECAIKIKEYFPLFKILQTETSQNNINEANRYGNAIFGQLVSLSAKYKCSLYALIILICNIVEMLQLLPVEILKSINFTGKVYSTEFHEWVLEKEKQDRLFVFSDKNKACN